MMYKLAFMSCVSTLGLTSPALAQTGPGSPPASSSSQEAASTSASAPQSSLEDIVVTAQRRTERLTTVPVAVTAVTAQQLELRQISAAVDITTVVPNLTGFSTQGQKGGVVLFIRGLGTTSNLAFLEPAVGFYVDDVLRPRITNNNVSFFDIDRIEVLRGPQGTTFGRNSTGGAVNVITTKPSDKFGGHVEVGYGTYNERLLRGTVDVPVSDKLRTKLSGFYTQDDGWLINQVNGSKGNKFETIGGRFAAEYLPTTNLTWNGSAEVSHTQGLIVRSITGDPLHTRLIGVQGGATDDLIADALANRGLRANNDSYNYASNFEWRITGGPTVNVITGFSTFSSPLLNDQSGITTASPTPSYLVANLSGHAFTQEIKGSGSALNGFIDYVAGVFYIRERNNLFNSLVTGNPLAVACQAGSRADGNIRCPNGRLGYSATRSSRVDTESAAPYAQLDFHLTHALIATGGLRWTYERKNLAIIAPNVGGLTDADLARYGVPEQLTSKRFTPRISLKYQPDQTKMIYVSRTQGFKSGGFNVGITPDASTAIRPEQTTSYEVGGKAELLQRRLSIAVDAFTHTTRDLQLTYQQPNLLVPGATLQLLTNAGDVRVKGVEWDISALPLPGLNVFLTGGYQDGHYLRTNPLAASFTTSTGVFVKGIDPNNDLTQLPAFSLTTGANYKWPIAALDGSLIVSGQVAHQSSIWRTAANSIAPVNTRVPGVTLADFALGYERADRDWRLTVECKNCFNQFRATGFVSNAAYYADGPRRVRAVVSKRF